MMILDTAGLSVLPNPASFPATFLLPTPPPFTPTPSPSRPPLPPLPCPPPRYTALGEMLTLGATDATVAGPEGLDVLKLNGPLAAAARRLVYAARQPTNEQRLVAGMEWLKAPIALLRGAGGLKK